MKTRTLWVSFTLVMVISFGILGYFGREIYRKAPPIPEKVITSDGSVLMTGSDIRDGQNVWQSMGGQEVGSIWGHGAYLAPDWTADWLHREAVFILDEWAQKDYSMKYDDLDKEKQAMLQQRLKQEMRTNTYDQATNMITVSSVRAKAFQEISKHYAGLFMDDASRADLREAYSIPKNSIKDAGRMAQMNAFFFWASWVTVSERPGETISYTNNWPAEKLVGNEPTGSLILWTGFSVIILLLGIGLLVLRLTQR